LQYSNGNWIDLSEKDFPQLSDDMKQEIYMPRRQIGQPAVNSGEEIPLLYTLDSPEPMVQVSVNPTFLKNGKCDIASIKFDGENFQIDGGDPDEPVDFETLQAKKQDDEKTKTDKEKTSAEAAIAFKEGVYTNQESALTIMNPTASGFDFNIVLNANQGKCIAEIDGQATASGSGASYSGKCNISFSTTGATIQVSATNCTTTEGCTISGTYKR
jgi:hypothetical protein